MITKTALLCCALVSTPICLVTTMQDPQDRAPDGKAQPQPPVEVRDAVAPSSGATEQELAELRAKIRELQGQLERARATATDHEQHAARLKAQLMGCMDLLEQSTRRQRDRNCTPSRSRRLLTYYQWMHQNGHEQRAEKMLTRAIKTTSGRSSSLNNLAWHLMTDKSTAGKLDLAALALAERMQKNGHLRHNELDTVALAKFLNGHLTAAVELQRQAIQRGGRSDEYRRRLRVYEAALQTTQPTPNIGGTK